jgi:hypothetical protein
MRDLCIDQGFVCASWMSAIFCNAAIAAPKLDTAANNFSHPARPFPVAIHAAEPHGRAGGRRGCACADTAYVIPASTSAVSNPRCRIGNRLRRGRRLGVMARRRGKTVKALMRELCDMLDASPEDIEAALDTGEALRCRFLVHVHLGARPHWSAIADIGGPRGLAVEEGVILPVGWSCGGLLFAGDAWTRIGAPHQSLH